MCLLSQTILQLAVVHPLGDRPQPDFVVPFGQNPTIRPNVAIIELPDLG
jgi:hypothetical protein